MTALLIAGGTVVGPDGVAPADVLVVDGAIMAVGPSLSAPDGAVVVSADGLFVAPGFIDLQLNGAHGIDLTEEPERLWEVAARAPPLRRDRLPAHDRHVTAGGRGSGAWPRWPRRPAGFAGAEPLGLHLEGPMLNPDGEVRTPPRCCGSRSLRWSSGWSRQAGVALVTLAPELPGALPVIEQLVGSGVVVVRRPHGCFRS